VRSHSFSTSAVVPCTMVSSVVLLPCARQSNSEKECSYDCRASWCIAVKSSVPQGMIVCFNEEVGWCVRIAVILML
jgi:hypothetical protein